MAKSITEALMQIENIKKQLQAEKSAGKKPSLSEKTVNLMENVIRNITGDFSKGRADMHEALTTTDTSLLIPKIVEGQIIEAAEPEYLGAKFMNKIKVEGGSSTVFVIPIIGELRAYEVGEGQPYNEDAIEQTTLEESGLEIKVAKYGVKISVTEEVISDSSWDILGINTRKMGRALARLKEEKIFLMFTRKGHVVFDNNKRAQIPQLGTTGNDENGLFNDTLAVEDLLDLALAVMANDHNPTDLIMHPLIWLVFAKNSMIGNGLTFGALGGQNVSPWGTIQGTPGPAGFQNNGQGQKYILKPEDVQNRLPLPMTVNFSPFVYFDKTNKRFDMYCIDRDEVGVIAQKEEISINNWSDPEKDIRCIKAKERYGIGVLDNGKGIAVARNLAVATTYPKAPVIYTKEIK